MPSSSEVLHSLKFTLFVDCVNQEQCFSSGEILLLGGDKRKRGLQILKKISWDFLCKVHYILKIC